MLTFFLTFFSINLKHQSIKINYFLIKNKNNLILNLKKIMKKYPLIPFITQTKQN
jgi:hypothetical protein